VDGPRARRVERVVRTWCEECAPLARRAFVSAREIAGGAPGAVSVHALRAPHLAGALGNTGVLARERTPAPAQSSRRGVAPGCAHGCRRRDRLIDLALIRTGVAARRPWATNARGGCFDRLLIALIGVSLALETTAARFGGGRAGVCTRRESLTEPPSPRAFGDEAAGVFVCGSIRFTLRVLENVEDLVVFDVSGGVGWFELEGHEGVACFVPFAGVA
jgi:hypothetical protein